DAVESARPWSSAAYNECRMRARSMPTPLVELACGSASTNRVFRSAVASEAARLTAVVVFPTPPFWLAIAITRGIGNYLYSNKLYYRCANVATNIALRDGGVKGQSFT